MQARAFRPSIPISSDQAADIVFTDSRGTPKRKQQNCMASLLTTLMETSSLTLNIPLGGHELFIICSFISQFRFAYPTSTSSFGHIFMYFWILVDTTSFVAV